MFFLIGAVKTLNKDTHVAEKVLTTRQLLRQACFLNTLIHQKLSNITKPTLHFFRLLKMRYFNEFCNLLLCFLVYEEVILFFLRKLGNYVHDFH